MALVLRRRLECEVTEKSLKFGGVCRADNWVVFCGQFGALCQSAHVLEEVEGNQ